MKYSTQLKSILQAGGLSQEDLARRLDVSFVTLNAWVNERSVPRAKALVKIELLYLDIAGTDTIQPAERIAMSKAAMQCTTSPHDITSIPRVVDKLVLYLTYHTNTIEGSTMTLADTQDVLFNKRTLTNRTQIEQLEARNHQTALLWLLEQIQLDGFIISSSLVNGLHLRLMNGVIGDAGEYRQHNVRIMGSRVTVSNYLKVPELMDVLVQQINSKVDSDILHLAKTHATFEKIHPFSDGNGRVGRLLMLAQALQLGLTPPLVLKERRQAYYKYLEVAKTSEQYDLIEYFIAESIVSSHELLFGDAGR